MQKLRAFSHRFFSILTPKVAPRQAQGISKGPKGAPKPPLGRLKTIQNRSGTPPGYPREPGRLQGYPREGKMTPKSIKNRLIEHSWSLLFRWERRGKVTISYVQYILVTRAVTWSLFRQIVVLDGKVTISDVQFMKVYLKLDLEQVWGQSGVEK